MENTILYRDYIHSCQKFLVIGAAIHLFCVCFVYDMQVYITIAPSACLSLLGSSRSQRLFPFYLLVFLRIFVCISWYRRLGVCRKLPVDSCWIIVRNISNGTAELVMGTLMLSWRKYDSAK